MVKLNGAVAPYQLDSGQQQTKVTCGGCRANDNIRGDEKNLSITR